MAKGPAKLGGLGDRFPVMGLYDDSVEEGSFVASFDHENPDNQMYLFKGNQPGTLQAKNLLGEVLDIVAWVAIKMRLPDEEAVKGDLVVKSTLILASGDTVSTMSTGIARSLDLIRTFVPDTIYKPPLRMTLKGADVGQAGDMLILQPVETKPESN